MKIALIGDQYFESSMLKRGLEDYGEVEIFEDFKNIKEYIINSDRDIYIMGVFFKLETGENIWSLDELKKIVDKSINKKIIILTRYNKFYYRYAAKELGVEAFVVKEAKWDDFIEIFKKASKGIKTEIVYDEANLENLLVKKEIEIVRAFIRGYADKEVESRLSITSGTLRRHKHNIFRKLYVNTKAQAIVEAIKLGYGEI